VEVIRQVAHGQVLPPEVVEQAGPPRGLTTDLQEAKALLEELA
jgi:hypothetical protein